MRVSLATVTTVMALKDLQYFENHYFAFNRWLLQFAGLWPDQQRSKRLIRIRYINVVLFVSFVTQIWSLCTSEINMIRIVEILPTLLPLICFTCCYNNILYNYTTMKQLFDRIRSDWTELIDRQEITFIQKCARENRLYTITIAIIFYFYIVFIMMPSTIRVILNTAGVLNDTKLTLPIHIDFALKNTSYYYITLCCQLACICVTCTLGIAHYSMYISLIQHSYALCGIVIIKLNGPFKEDSSRSSRFQSNNAHSVEYYWIVDTIRWYDKITSFVDLINVIYSKTYLVEVSMGMLYVITDYIYFCELIAESENIGKILTSCTYTIASLIMIYAICYLGQKFIDHYDDIFLKCCQIPFYKLSIKTQKAFLFMLMRAMKPCGFSMKGMIMSSHELFAKIMRTSFSFATVFYNMH